MRGKNISIANVASYGTVYIEVTCNMPKEKYVYKLIFSNNTVVSDQKYNSLHEAYAAGLEAISDYNTGGEVLHMSNPGEYPDDWEQPILEATIDD